MGRGWVMIQAKGRWKVGVENWVRSMFRRENDLHREKGLTTKARRELVGNAINGWLVVKWAESGSLIKKKIKFSSYIRKFRMEQLQSHMWLTASSYMGKYLRISSCIRKPL
jgi:hypothetical protein